MANNIVLTLPAGEVTCMGKEVTFQAPCDCADALKLVIGTEQYDVVDSLGNIVTGTSGYWVSGALVTVTLNTTTLKAYLLNAATSRPLSHTHTKSQITDFPASLPASDVYSWAKASTKPTYTYSEVGAAASSHTHTAASVGAAAASHNQAASTITAGTFAGNVVAPSTDDPATARLRNTKASTTDIGAGVALTNGVIYVVYE